MESRIVLFQSITMKFYRSLIMTGKQTIERLTDSNGKMKEKSCTL